MPVESMTPFPQWSYGRIPSYGIIYGVIRTTIYLPEDMKTAIEREAVNRGSTEAEVIRRAVEQHLDAEWVPSREFPLFDEPLGFNLAGRVDQPLRDPDWTK